MLFPLALERLLYREFPEMREIRVSREGLGLCVNYVMRDGCVLDASQLKQWGAEHTAQGLPLMECRAVLALPAGSDDTSRLRKTRLTRDVVEDAQITMDGVLDLLNIHFYGLVGPGNEQATIHISDYAPPGTSDAVAAELAIIAPSEFVLQLRPAPAASIVARARPWDGLSSRARHLAEEDHQLLTDHLQGVLEGNPVPQFAPLPPGAATIATGVDGLGELVPRLALFDTVLVEVPPDGLPFEETHGVPFAEFLEALPTGRLVPFLRHPLRTYDRAILDAIADAGVRTVLPGEARLKQVAAVVSAYPYIGMIERHEDEAREVHARLRSGVEGDPNAELLRRYMDAVANVATRLRPIARGGESLAIALDPLGEFLANAVGTVVGKPYDQVYFCSAISTHAKCSAFGARPMCAEGSTMDPYLALVFGLQAGGHDTETGVDLVDLVDPVFLGDILLNTSQASLREFATAFGGQAIEDLRRLLRSPRLWSEPAPRDVIEAFNAEARRFETSHAPSLVATLLGVAASSATLSPLVGVLTTLGLAAARPVLEKLGPTLTAKAEALMTRSTVEGVLLAKVRKSLPVR